MASFGVERALLNFSLSPIVCRCVCVCVCTLNKRPSVEFSSFLYVVKKEAPTLHVFIWYNSFHNFLRSFQSEKVKQL